MVSVSCFKSVFCESDVGVFLVVFAGYCGLVNNVRLHYSDWVCTAVMSNDVMKDLRG